MADPITLAMLAGTVGSSIIGGINANNANQLNADISLLNYYEQQRANQAAEGEARRQRAEQQLGQTDAAGNRTYFIPGRGWVTELATDQQQLQDLTEAEQLRQLTDGAARNAENEERARDRRGREDTLATEAEREFRAARRPDEGSLRQLLLARGAETRNRAADRAGDAAARQAIRGGGRNAAATVQGARASADAESARQAGVDAALQARGMVDQEFSADRDAARTVYDYFRRASTTGASPVTGVQPQGPGRTSTGVQDQALLNSLGRAPQLDYQQPNNALPDTIADITSGLSAYRDMNRSDKLYDSLLARQGQNVGGF